jgi:hypothetical protein
MIDRRRFIASLLSSVAVLRLPPAAGAALSPLAPAMPVVPGFGPWGVHEALQAWADGLITPDKAMKLVGLENVDGLRRAARSSGVAVPVDPEFSRSCGCVMCDLLVPIDGWIGGLPYHRARGDVIVCSVGADPMGYDTSTGDLGAIRQMAEDAIAGRDKELVKAEAKRFAAYFKRSRRPKGP